MLSRPSTRSITSTISSKGTASAAPANTPRPRAAAPSPRSRVSSTKSSIPASSSPSGIKPVSQSTKATASKISVKIRYSSVCKETPCRHTKAPKAAAVSPSVMGQRAGISAPHQRQRPFCRSQEKMGTSSKGPKTWPQESQRLRPVKKDCPARLLATAQPTKLASTAPNRAASARHSITTKGATENRSFMLSRSPFGVLDAEIYLSGTRTAKSARVPAQGFIAGVTPHRDPTAGKMQL